MGLSTVHDYLERAARAGIGWPIAEGLGEAELEANLFGNQLPLPATVRGRRNLIGRRCMSSCSSTVI
jgi:hypothetical protein